MWLWPARQRGGRRLLDLDELKELLHILDAREIIEFELEEEGKKLRIRKAAANHVAPVPVVAASFAPAAIPNLAASAVPVAPAAAPSAAGPVSAVEPAADEGTLVVKSPIVGTFYRS